MKRAGFVIEDLIDRDDEIGSAPGLSDDAQDVPILINGWHKHNATSGRQTENSNQFFSVFISVHTNAPTFYRMKPLNTIRLMSQSGAGTVLPKNYFQIGESNALYQTACH